MKILCLSHVTYTNFPRAQKQIETLSETGEASVTAIAPWRNSTDPPEMELGDATVRHERPPISLPNVSVLKIVNVLIAMGVLAYYARKEDADIVHCIGMYALFVGVVLRGWRSDSRLTYDAPEDYGCMIEVAFQNAIGSALGSIVRVVENRLVRRAEVVFTINSSDGLPAERLRGHNPNTVVLENVPKRSEFDVDHDHDPYSEVEDRTILVYVGGVSQGKGGDMMLDVMDRVADQCPEALLVVIGGGADPYMDHLRERIEREGLTGSVELLGPIQYDRVPAYLANADIGLQLYQPGPWTSRSMASSTIFRHMGFGLPLVVTDLPGMGRQIKEYECGLAPSVRDPQAIADAVCRLVEGPELRSEFGDHGRELVESTYNWGVEQEKFLDQMPLDSAATGRR